MIRKKTKKTFASIILATAFVVASGTTAVAEDAWSYRVTPYAWVPSLSLDAAIGPNPPATSETDLFDILDFALLMSGEARKGRWGVITEFNYLDLGDEASVAGGLVNFETDLKGFMIGAALAYRFFESPKVAADVFGGARLWSLDTEIDFVNLPSISREATFTDPIVGVRGQYEIDNSWFLTSLAEVGGFGVGSEFQWELLGRVGYRVSDTFSIGIGYRHLELDFDRSGVDASVAISGPFLAVDIVF